MQQYEITMKSVQELKTQTFRFTLSPNLWNNLHLRQSLEWKKVVFDRDSAERVPNKQTGVYSFVLKPNLAGIDLAYLLYVGKTKNFRARFNQYLRHQTEEKTKRLHIQHMLRTWPNHLMFYYAPIDAVNTVDSVEDELISAFKPPFNRQYPAKYGEAFRVLDAP